MKTNTLKSPLLELKDIIAPPVNYSTDEELYLEGLRKKLESARNQRDQGREEWNGMDYITYYQSNERLANTYIQPKKNKEDTNFQSGTIRQKLLALLSAINNLDLGGDISAFDKEGLKIQGLGDAMEDIMLKTNELDGDDEKKLMRQYELFKQGTVFVEEVWDERMQKDKKMSGKFDGKVDSVKWTTELKKAFARPSRNYIPGINVYLGDITRYSMTEQPYVFTVDVKPYEEAKTIFSTWQRWENVSQKIKKFDPAENSNINNSDWRLLQTQDGHVEIIRYQDKWNNEFAVLLNGVLMTPVGLPLPWGYEDYNIAQQNLEPIHAKFSYGKGLVAKMKDKVALFDEMMRLAVLKTQKSFMPPYINLSGRILSSRVFMPGKITHGIPRNTLFPISDKEVEGVTQSEFNMIKELQDSLNQESVSPTFQGQQSKTNTTATEIIELQRQAKMVMGLAVSAMMILEWKLEWLRLQNLLVNWFNPEDEVVDEARGVIKEKFRRVSVERSIDGKGMGRRIVIPTKEIPSSSNIMKSEDAMSEQQGMPVRLIFLNPDEVKSSKLIWQIVIRPKERKTSETEKLLFRAFIQDAIPLGADMHYLQERFAANWGIDPQKLFPVNASPMPQPGQPTGAGSLSAGVNLPTPEKAMASQVKAGMGMTQ